MGERMIVVASDFTRHPGGRYRDDGPFSGEEFRENILWPAIQTAQLTGERLIILLDGTDGYAASFLEEAFGGLVRHHSIKPKNLSQVMEIRTTDPLYSVYKGLAEKYIQDASIMDSRDKN